MTRRAAPLTGEAVEALPDPCRSCGFWELGGRVPDDRGPADPATAISKQAWVAAAVQDGLHPGRVVWLEGEIAAHAVFAPAQRFTHRHPTLPRISDDAWLLATIWVQPQWRGLGIGRLLLHACARDAIHAGAAGVEAIGDRRWQERTCLLPASWLLHEGFEVHREHPRRPALRLELRRTVRWAQSLEHALGELVDQLPARAPVRRPVAGSVTRPPSSAG